MRKPYYVCGGLQDNGSWCGPSAVRSQNGILNSDWFRVGGGDGFYTANDPTDWSILYSESQDGATSRLDSAHAGDRAASVRAGRASWPRRPGARRRESPWTRASLAQFGFGPGAANGNIVPAAAAGHALPLLLEHAVHALVAQPVHHLSGRRAAVQVDGPRRHVGRLDTT